MNTVYRLTFWSCACALALHSLILSAAVPPDKKLAIERKISDELKQTLKELVKEEDVAKRLGFEYPVKEPRLTLSAVKRLSDRAIRELAVEKHPDSWVDEQLKKMAEKYEQWKIGDDVVVYTKGQQKFDEKLRLNSTHYILVGPNKIRKEDMETHSLLHVDPVKAAEVKQQDKNKLRKQLLARREAYIREIRLDKTRELYLEQGYILITGRWTPKHEYFRKVLEAERERLTTIIQEPLEYKHYYHAGYRKFKDEWYTPEEAARLREIERIENELQPPAFMAEMDKLNAEYLAGAGTTYVEDDTGGLFDDDTTTVPEKKDKTEESNPFDQ